MAGGTTLFSFDRTPGPVGCSRLQGVCMVSMAASAWGVCAHASLPAVIHDITPDRGVAALQLPW
jgi:hypothetical protein